MLRVHTMSHRSRHTIILLWVYLTLGVTFSGSEFSPNVLRASLASLEDKPVLGTNSSFGFKAIPGAELRSLSAIAVVTLKLFSHRVVLCPNCKRRAEVTTPGRTMPPSKFQEYPRLDFHNFYNRPVEP